MLKKLITGALLLIGAPAFSSPMISEFMADNRRSSIDDDDDRSDWIEIYNPGGTPANLRGWFLTDDPDHELKWEFPAVNLPARGYLVVFASGKNRINLNAPLHTNFVFHDADLGFPLTLLVQEHFLNSLVWVIQKS